MKIIQVQQVYGMYTFEYEGYQVWCLNEKEIKDLSQEFGFRYKMCG